MIPKGTLSKMSQAQTEQGKDHSGWAKKFSAGDTAYFVIVRSNRPYRTQRGTTLIMDDGRDGLIGWEYRCDKFQGNLNQSHLFETLEEALRFELDLNIREAEYAENQALNIRNQIIRLQKLQETCQQEPSFSASIR